MQEDKLNKIVDRVCREISCWPAGRSLLSWPAEIWNKF